MYTSEYVRTRRPAPRRSELRARACDVWLAGPHAPHRQCTSSVVDLVKQWALGSEVPPDNLIFYGIRTHFSLRTGIEFQ